MVVGLSFLILLIVIKHIFMLLLTNFLIGFGLNHVLIILMHQIVTKIIIIIFKLKLNPKMKHFLGKHLTMLIMFIKIRFYF